MLVSTCPIICGFLNPSHGCYLPSSPCAENARRTGGALQGVIYIGTNKAHEHSSRLRFSFFLPYLFASFIFARTMFYASTASTPIPYSCCLAFDRPSLQQHSPLIPAFNRIFSTGARGSAVAAHGPGAVRIRQTHQGWYVRQVPHSSSLESASYFFVIAFICSPSQSLSLPLSCLSPVLPLKANHYPFHVSHLFSHSILTIISFMSLFCSLSQFLTALFPSLSHFGSCVLLH